VGVDEELQAEGRPRRPGRSSSPPPAGGRNCEADFKRQKRSNETHVSTTDPDAKLYRKGPGMEARLAFLGHALMENRSGLLVDACITKVSGHAERFAALAMIESRADRPRAITLGADRGYDAEDFVNEFRSMNVRRTWRKTLRAGRAVRRSMGGRPVTPAIPRASGSASASRRASAGSRLSRSSTDRNCTGWTGSEGHSPSPP
jgi:hypothetical protein